MWECDPTGAKPAVARPQMGLFQHEAAAVDPIHQHVYLTEDVNGGGLYRFVPSAYPDLAAGVLEIACGDGCSPVVWKPVPDPGFTGGKPLREQVRDSLKFARGEGIWYDAGLVYVATTTDETIHVYDTNTAILSVLYRAGDVPGTPLRGIDNLHVSRSGDLFVAEDSYTDDPDAMDVCIITPERKISRFLKLTGPGHFMAGAQSETIGITFDPSGTRMYLGSQRYQTSGIVYEITGPFRQDHPAIAAPTFEACPPPPPPPAPPTTVSGLGTNGGAPGLPIGIDVGKRISIDSLIRNGLALGITLDAAATVKVRITARVTTNGRRRTVTLATVTRKPKRGHTTLRIKPSKSQIKFLRARRRRAHRDRRGADHDARRAGARAPAHGRPAPADASAGDKPGLLHVAGGADRRLLGGAAALAGGHVGRVPVPPVVRRGALLVRVVVLGRLVQQVGEGRDVHGSAPREPRREFLEQPGVAVGVAERGPRLVGLALRVRAAHARRGAGEVEPAGAVEHLGHVDAAGDQVGAGRFDVGDGEQAVARPGRGGGDAGAEDDRRPSSRAASAAGRGSPRGSGSRRPAASRATCRTAWPGRRRTRAG